MNRVGARHLGGADDGRHVQVTVGAARRADADILIGKPHMKRIFVGLGVHRDGFDAKLAARDDDAHRDFAAIGDQDFLKHRCVP